MPSPHDRDEFIGGGDPLEGFRLGFGEGLMEWPGHVADMPAVLAKADMVVLPSYREGLSKTLIEAAASARPLITANAPGYREVVTDGVGGRLVPIRNAEALARAIANRRTTRRLGEAARAKALAEFDEGVVPS